MKRLPKRQFREDFGFTHFYTNGFHYYLFIDHLENETKTMDERPEFYRGGLGVFTAYKVNNQTGETTKFPMVNLGEIPQVLGNEVEWSGTAAMLKLSESEFLIEGKVKGKFILMKFNIN